MVLPWEASARTTGALQGAGVQQRRMAQIPHAPSRRIGCVEAMHQQNCYIVPMTRLGGDHSYLQSYANM